MTTRLRLFAAVLFGAALAAGMAAAQPVQRQAIPRARLDTDAAVQSTLDAMNAVLGRRDVRGFMALFDDSDEIMLVGSDVGETFSGRAEVSKFISAMYALPFTFSFEMPRVTIRRQGNSAWAFVDGAMVHTGADGAATRTPYRFAIVMVKREQGWRWLLFHGAIPRSE